MNTQNNAAKFAFFYMLSLVALIFMALSSGMIIFQIINKNILDVIDSYRSNFSSEQLKFAISALIISAPIYYFTMRQIFKNLVSGALEKDSEIRKWLTYFVLLVTSCVMIGWLIGTVNSFLDGELTTKFILKALTAIGISATVFSFYLYDIKRENVNVKDKIVQTFLYASLIAIIVVFTASLFTVESPTETRNRKLDEAILEKFDEIDRGMGEYYNSNKNLPENLDELVLEFSYITEDDLVDPTAKKKFEYKKISVDTYELCADFRMSNKGDNEDDYRGYKDRWPHDAGHQCLKQKVRDFYDKELMMIR
ncbi:MAG: DUF5671 domain-containing protein [Candidatus Falkowbacteria bacterium]